MDSCTTSRLNLIICLGAPTGAIPKFVTNSFRETLIKISAVLVLTTTFNVTTTTSVYIKSCDGLFEIHLPSQLMDTESLS